MTKSAEESKGTPQQRGEGWFQPWGWLYRPVSYAGWIVVLVVFMFCLHTAVFVDSRVHSVSDTLYGVFPYWIPALGIYIWIGANTCRKETPENPS